MKYQPPYTITPAIVNMVAEIGEAIGRLTVLTDQARALRLRRINRIRTIHGSLAIEGNTLSEAQEVKNALAAYDRIEMTISDKPNSRLHQYRLTDKGRQWLAQHGDGQP